MNAGNTIFTVEFLKQLKPEEVASEITNCLADLPAMSATKLKKFCKDVFLPSRIFL